MRSITIIALIVALAVGVAIAQENPVENVDATMRIYTGPVFWTGDAELPQAEAVAVDATGRIVEVYAQTPKGSPWPIIKLPGAFATAGLVDAHLHVSGIGRRSEQVALESAGSAAEAAALVQAWIEDHPEVSVVRGRGWDQSRWPDREFPSWRELEGVSSRPMVLRRVDGHAAWINRTMLDLARITRDSPDPDGGRILRDAAGEPTGVLVDNAVDLLDPVLPVPTDADRERWLLAGLNACADVGLTAVHDMGQNTATCDIAERLAIAGRLPIRLFVYLEGSEDDTMAAMSRYAPHPNFMVQGMKYYTDGALGSRGAALLAVYDDEPTQRGLLVTDPMELERRVDMVHRRGFQCAIHAIGDRGNRTALDAIHKAQYGALGRRHRVEHAQVVHPDDFARFVAEGAVASVQPTHCTSDMRWAEQRLGAERVKGAYAWRTFVDAGTHLPLGSDAPVEDWNPMPGIYAAITRQDVEGHPDGGWFPEQRLTWQEAVAGFTAEAAYAVHREEDLGRIAPGCFFDVTVMDIDPRNEPTAWLKAVPTAVFVGGERIR